MSFSNRFSKGVNNLFSASLTNFLIVLSLIIILILTYITTKRLDLFGDPEDKSIDDPVPTVDIRIITDLINNYKSKIVQQSEFAKVLATQQANIDSYGKQFTDIINSSN